MLVVGTCVLLVRIASRFFGLAELSLSDCLVFFVVVVVFFFFFFFVFLFFLFFFFFFKQKTAYEIHR